MSANFRSWPARTAHEQGRLTAVSHAPVISTPATSAGRTATLERRPLAPAADPELSLAVVISSPSSCRSATLKGTHRTSRDGGQMSAGSNQSGSSPTPRSHWRRVASIHQGRMRCVPGVRHPVPWLPPAALRRVRPRQAAGVQLQAARALSLMRHAPDVADSKRCGVGVSAAAPRATASAQ